ncbi:MAG: hypothetical protein LBD43_03060 [Holosporales bacterium]|jgi:hypothetical protein|nr:hypothetical protein [Holosporales bacterium]
MKKQTMAIIIALQAAIITCASNGSEAPSVDGNRSDGRSHHPSQPIAPLSPLVVLNSRLANKCVADKLEAARDGATALIDALTRIYAQYWDITRYRPMHRDESALLEYIITLPSNTKNRSALGVLSAFLIAETLDMFGNHGRLAGLQAAIIAFEEVVVSKNYTKEVRCEHHEFNEHV